ncbi:MAG: SLBB domain-containing protein [Candidatus Lokiarchaeota archaeon]|nr:SLBB domain-containing protein [Candidatus Lokiarchaeota archaeon]
MILNLFDDLQKLRNELVANIDPKRSCITVCSGTGCQAYGCNEIAAKFHQILEEQKLTDKVDIKRTGCHGFCERGPIVVIYPEELCYLQVKPEDILEIISKTIKKGEIIKRLVYTENEEELVHESEIPFYKNQKRLILGNNLKINPKKIEDYIAIGGYSALIKALKMKPEDVLEEIKKANLRGRGGGGFPSGIKWESTRNASGVSKYIIVNCDEGDPGAYMNRSLMEGNPHSVLEGFIIGAYAIGSNQGYIYIREEYPLAVENVYIALDQARKYGLLGENILGSGLNFDIKVFRGAGAFVSGESSALIKSLEGKVGEPIPKYIHMSEEGLYGKPTNLNNVETWANVPFIIKNGSDWFKAIGSENNPGTKIFSLVGNVKNTGLVEVPLGTSLRDIIYKIGGGIKDGKKFKAVQTGGPSGGCIPEEFIDLSIDFDELSKLGSMMGSGGMIVMDEDTCMVDIAKYFLNFLVDESCGKCVPCREGIRQMLNILNMICDGNGEEKDLELLEEISNVMKKSCLCALGTTASNPVLTTLKYFKEEYYAHIKDKKCPARVCKNLIIFKIIDDCTGCGVCAVKCPKEAISGEKKELYIIDQDKCIKCGICIDSCQFNAIIKE